MKGKNHISLFSGLGGFDIAAETVGWNNVAHCEINPFARRILKYYWPEAISYGSIIEADFSIWRGRVFCLSGGFPCQPFSHAGKRAGTLDGRYLWPEYFRAIREIQPVTVVGENVAGILSMAEREVFARVDSRKNIRWEDFDEYEAVYTRQEELLVGNIIKDLEGEGYRVQLFNIPAAGKGAPHRRERIWFVAHSDEFEHACRRPKQDRQTKSQGKSKGYKRERIWTIPSGNAEQEFTADTNCSMRKRRSNRNQPQERCKPNDQQFRGRYELLKSDFSQFPSQSPLCGGDDGLPPELDGITFSKWRNESIKGYGNAIVPQVAMEIFKALDQPQF